MKSWKDIMLSVLLAALGLSALFYFVPRKEASAQRRAAIRGNQGGSAVQPNQQGLQFRLSEGQEQQSREAPIATPPAAPLAESEAQRLLSRLSPLKTEADDEKDFALRDRSLPPPRTGQTINEAFPPPTSAAAPETAASGPLEVLRFAPEGDIPIAPHLSVTFSQPMVPVTSQEDAATNVPVKLTPLPPGKWRWVGTKTILFEPANRFPMATNYTVEIPAGTKSLNGGALAAAKRWTFNTPPLNVKTMLPQNGPHNLEPLFFVEFDQRIDPDAVLPTIKLQTDARVLGKSFSLRLATPAEIESNEQIRAITKNAQKDRWLAFKATEPLPAGANFNVVIGPGTPSAEGPRRTEQGASYKFFTYAPLKLESHQCGYDGRCEPFWPWSLNFNNPLDQQAFDPKWIRIAPEVPGVKIQNFGNSINIQGQTKGNTLYRVTIDAALRDQFGQTLGKEQTVTFNVGPAQPNLAAAGEGLVVLDPAGGGKFSVFSVNHQQLKVTLYAVGPEHWAQFSGFMRNNGGGYRQRGQRGTPLPEMGRLVYSKVINVNARPDELIETALDLQPALDNGVGQMALSVEAVQPPKNEWERRAVYAWLQATNIGLDAFVDQTELTGWANSLKDGKPLDGVEMILTNSNSLARATAGAGVKTDAKGLARLSLPSQERHNLLVARKGNDVALLPQNFYWQDEQYGGWQRRSVNDRAGWHVFDDRGLYRPGEEVKVKGWLRRIGGGKAGDVALFNNVGAPLTYTLRDSRGNEITKGTLRLNALGGFDTAFKLPPTMNLGNAQLDINAAGVGADDNHFTHVFQVQEFRRPEYEVNVKASEGPHFVRGAADLTVAASYYAGGGLPNAEVNWQVTATPTNYTPPNRGDFTFGKWTPWWIYQGGYEGGRTQNYSARTDAAGKHRLRIDFDTVNPPRPTSIQAYAYVQDVNRQSLSSSTTLLVHPAELYVGLRSPRMFVQQGEPLLVQSIVTDLDGKAITNREIRMRAVQLDWSLIKGEWKQEEKNPQECIVKSAAEAVQCRFETKEGGQYRITATIIDDRERANQSELTLWVAGGKQPPQRELAKEKVELIPNRKEYQAGETAEILVQAPFAGAEGVLTLRRAGLVSTERFTMNGASHTLKIPINDAWTPNVHVQVDLVGAAERTDDAGQPKAGVPKRPAFASGELNLPIPPTRRKLAVTVTPRDKALEPAGETSVEVQLRDAAGKPVAGGEVALVVVDEAVLALTGYKLGDPLATFYPQRGDEVEDHHLREKVVLARPDDLISQLQQSQQGQQVMRMAASEAVYATGSAGDRAPMAPPAPMAEMRAKSGTLGKLGGPMQPEPIQVRTNFNALAFFAASLPTDANGRAAVKVKLPDNLTRYRIMAVAAAGEKQFGTGESAITARLPLMVRPSAPRFLNFGDRIELPAVVQNQTDAPMQVEVAVRAANAQLTAGQGRRVTVPANDRVEVRFPATTLKPGTARFQFAASAGRWSDAAEVSLPVWTPATTEAFATYGEVDAGAIVQPVKAPSDAIKQFGGLEVTTSSTQVQALTDAVIYLTNYPFECAEQISSRVLAIAALRDVLAAFDAKGLPPAEELAASVKRDIERLQGMQNGDGGFGFWRRGDESWPYISIHTAHALQRAKEKKFDVPQALLDQSRGYLRIIEQRIPHWYSPESRRAVIAYALYVRNRMGDRDAAKARVVIAEGGGVDKTSLETLGWLLPVLAGDAASQAQVTAIRRHFGNRAEETAGTAHFTTSYSDGAHVLLHSDRRADGIILEALIGNDPQNDLIPKIARGLLAQRKAGRWDNTQENCWVLLALDRYFATYEKATPNFVARAWLGNAYAGEHAFRGRTTERHQVNVPMKYLTEQSGLQNLTLSKEGAGRMYYRIGMQYAPTSLQLKPADYGFTVTRVYEAVDKPDDVRRQEDGTWRIKAGAQVRVRLTLVAQARRYHVALVDPLPAGLEALNPVLATTGAIPRDPKDNMPNQWGFWRWWQWYEHQNMRDERVEAFASLLWEGVYNYTYVARATTPGLFIVPPTKAEEMYHPETFGRGASDRVVIE